VLHDAHACPCCGHRTLAERAGFEICPVCFWEDDGQDDVDAHVDRGGPNRGTLWLARANFLKFGACEGVAKQHVRRPTGDEPQARQWPLLGDVAVELIPSSDVSPWNLLHDGAVTGIERTGDRVSMAIDIPYLRIRFQEPGSAFRVDLFECSEVEHTPYDGRAVSSCDEIVSLKADIVTTKNEDGVIVVWGSAGVLRLRYRNLALRFDHGAPLALAALDECARAYWDEWERRRPQSERNEGDR
jgi:Cysteine-rich CPCC